MATKTVIFNNKVLQKQGRIKIPQPILDTLKLKEGAKVQILLDTTKDRIIIKRT